MADFKKTLDSWQRKATQKLEEIDEQIGLKEKIEEGTRVVADAAQKSVGYVRSEAEKTQIGRDAVKVAEDIVSTANDAAVGIGQKAGQAVSDATEKAAEVFDDTASTLGSNARRVAKVVGFGSSLSSTVDSASRSTRKAAEWVKNDPMRAAATGASMAIGAGLGIIFTGFSSHWLMNSAIPTYSVKKIAEAFDGYLHRREELIKNDRLSDADAERIRFERDIAKRIGAPMLGAFSFASGAVMMTQIFDTSTVKGFPVGSIISGNPLLEGVWFFGNGLVCLKTSYDFFMIALDGDEDVEKMVRDIKGLLPA